MVTNLIEKYHIVNHKILKVNSIEAPAIWKVTTFIEDLITQIDVMIYIQNNYSEKFMMRHLDSAGSTMATNSNIDRTIKEEDKTEGTISEVESTTTEDTMIQETIMNQTIMSLGGQMTCLDQ